MSSPRKCIEGVTLIEVMVAFVILSLSVTVLLRIFSGGLSNTVLSQQYADAVVLAQSQLARIGTVSEISAGVENGIANDRYAWKTVITPYYPWDSYDEETFPLSAYIVDVEVSWMEKGKERNVRLSSLKIQQNNVNVGRG